MSETNTNSHETERAQHTETLEETLERLHQLPYSIHGAEEDVPDDKDCYVFYLVATDKEDGDLTGIVWSIDPSENDKIPLTGDDVEGMKITTQLSEDLRSEVETQAAQIVRWWDTSVQYDLKSDTERGVSDAIRLTVGEESIDIANLTSTPLTEEEKAEVIEVIEQVNAFTGGRLFENTRGIALRDSDQFPDGVDGTHSTYGRFLSANLGVMRETPDAAERYNEYFDGKPPSRLQTILAHELGHAMDLVFGDYYFKDKFGWENIEDMAKYNRDIDCVGIEENVTSYGNTSAPEDFAELFAIMSLGGDVSKLPKKSQAMIEYIQSHRTEGFIGPQRAEVETLNGLTPRIPKRIAVKGYVAAELLTDSNAS